MTLSPQSQARLDAIHAAIADAYLRGESQDVIDAMEARYESALNIAMKQAETRAK